MIATARREPAVSGSSRPWLLQLPRLFVGAVLVATGSGKALDMAGFARVLGAYDLLPHGLNLLLAYTLPFVELATGVCLLAGRRVVAAAWVAVGLHVMLLVSVFVTLWRGLTVANCGCFGVFWPRPLTGQTAVEDTVMLAMSLLAVWGAKRP
jgi:uncharacterized membrane protein YphA (DoxX/SURF4 family)